MSKDDTRPAEAPFEQKVNTLIEEAKQNDEGKWELPEGLDEPTRFAVMAELRRRDTVSAYTKTQQENLQLKAERDQLAQGWEQEALSKLPQAEQDRLEELKHSDPEAWRVEVAKVEEAQRNAFQEKTANMSAEARKKAEKQRRVELLKAYNEENPESVLTDDIIKRELPPKYLDDLGSGKISFEEFLEKAHNFLVANKVIASGDEAPKGPDLSKVPGSSAPTDESKEADFHQSYKNETY